MHPVSSIMTLLLSLENTLNENIKIFDLCKNYNQSNIVMIGSLYIDILFVCLITIHKQGPTFTSSICIVIKIPTSSSHACHWSFVMPSGPYHSWFTIYIGCLSEKRAVVFHNTNEWEGWISAISWSAKVKKTTNKQVLSYQCVIQLFLLMQVKWNLYATVLQINAIKLIWCLMVHDKSHICEHWTSYVILWTYLIGVLLI